MLWKLIIWTALCTSADEMCMTGDYQVLDQTYVTETECTQSRQRKTWLSIDPKNNRAICLTTNAIEAIEYDSRTD